MRVPQETAEERWRPILGVEQVLVSVISMLADPNTDSPANVDAAVCAAPLRARKHPREHCCISSSPRPCYTVALPW